MMESTKIWHYDTLREFHKILYKNLLDHRYLVGQKSFEGEPYWVFTKDKVNFIIRVDHDHPIDYSTMGFPLKVIDYEKYESEGNQVFYEIIKSKSMKIPKRKMMTFREMVDSFIPFQHSNPEHFLLFRLIILASYIYRINIRLSTEAGFGKDSAVNLLREMTDQVSNLSASTMAKFEYALLCKIFVLNEISDINTEDRRNLQRLLLACGDFKSEYEKSTREGRGTQERYDISAMSIVMFYNYFEYYREIGVEDKFFDNMFTKATKDRIIPFRLEGVLDMEQFRQQFDAKKEFSRHLEFYQKFLATLEYYRENSYDELKKYKTVGMIKLKGRHPLSFDKICNVFNLYSESEQEYNALVNLALHCHLTYYTAMQDHQTLENFSSMPPVSVAEKVEEIVISDSLKPSILDEQVIDNTEPEKPIKINYDYLTALSWIEKHDSGNGIHEVAFLDVFQGEKGEALLSLLKQKGDVMEIKNKTIKLNI